MKKIFVIVSIIGFFGLISCGAQEDCRGRAENYKIQQQTSQTLVVNYQPEKR